MAITTFRFERPEQLKEINGACKTGNTINVAKVWSVARRQSQNGKTPWDGKIFAEFSTEGRKRQAKVYRVGADHEQKVVAWLKYTPALNWCIGNLEIVSG